MAELRFYFDYQSPYAYLAWTQLERIATRFAATVEPIPVLFAAILDALGTRGPAEVPARRRYLIRDVARIADRMGVPFTLPPAHPFNPLLALRLTSLALPTEQRRDLIAALFAAVWSSGTGVADPAVVAAIAARVGLSAAQLEAAASTETKMRLREQTEAAIALGIFGVPTIMVGDQMFWGCDSLPHLERFLERGDVVPGELVARWDRLPASATRPAAVTGPS